MPSHPTCTREVGTPKVARRAQTRAAMSSASTTTIEGSPLLFGVFVALARPGVARRKPGIVRGHLSAAGRYSAIRVSVKAGHLGGYRVAAL